MKNYTFLLAIFLAVQVQSQISFQKIYHNVNYPEIGHGYCLSSDGNYMIASQQGEGTYSVATLTKIDVTGNILWRKEFPGLWGFYSIVTTIDGGYAIAGNSDTLEAGDWDMFILKTDSSGNLQWCRFLGLDINSDIPTEITQGQDGGYFLTGEGDYPFDHTSYAFILKTDSSGSLLWDKIITCESIGPMHASHVSPTNDGGVIATGTYIVDDDHRLMMTKIDASGQISWTHCYGNNFWGNVSYQTSDGGFISSGMGHSANIPWGFLLLKTDNMGNLQWGKVYSNDGASAPDLIITAGGDYILAGNYQSLADSASIYLIKTNTLGDTVWTRFYELDSQLGYKGETTNSIIQTSDGGFLVGGQADKPQLYDTDIYLLKTDANGIAGCNLVNRPVVVESATPSSDTTITFSSGINSAAIRLVSVVSQITDTTLCLFDWINEYENVSSLDVYPNPATNQITINISAFSESEFLLEVKDILGRNVIRKKVYAGNVQLDVSNISRGIYLIGLTGKESFGRSIFYKQ